MTQEDVLQTYVQELLKKAHIDQMPDDFKQEYSAKLRVEVDRRLGLMAMNALDANAIEEFENFIDANESPKPGELIEFFATHIDDFDKKVAKTLAEFSEEFLAGAKNLDQNKYKI